MIKHNEYLLVEVPSMAFGFDINNYGDSSEFMYMLDIEEIDESIKHDETLITKPLPPGTYQLIGLASELTEEQWRWIVDKTTMTPVDLDMNPIGESEHTYWSSVNAHSNAMDAGYHLLRSHNLKPETTVVIKEIKK